MRAASLAMLAVLSGCLDLNALGQLNDLSVIVDDEGVLDDGGAPSDARRGSTLTWSSVSTGLPPGQATCIAIDPVTPANLYVGMAVGGVYRSIDSGATWQRAASGLSTLAVNAIIIDPTTPQTLYVGINGGGVYKTVDGATTWTASSTSLGNAVTYALAIDSASPLTIFAGAATGLYRSLDGGHSWSLVLTSIVRGVAIAHSSPTTVVASSFSGGAYVSVNGGAKFIAMNTGLTDTHAIAVAIDPRAATNVYLSTPSGMFHSVDGAATWAPTGPAVQAEALVVDPNTSTIVYAVAFASGIYRTGNGGATWSTLPTTANVGYGLGLAIKPDASTTIYVAALGVAKSINSGGTWSASSNGIVNTTVNVIAADQTASTTPYAGTPYAGQVVRTTATPTSWSLVNAGLSAAGSITALAVDPATPTNVYAGTAQGGIVKSTTRGGTWSSASTGLPSGIVSALAIDPNAPAKLYAGVASQGLFRSIDGALTWQAVNTGLGNVRAIFVDRSNGGVYAAGDGGFDGGAGGGVARSSDGETFTMADSGLTTMQVDSLVGDGNGNLYAGTNGGGVFASTDGALSWVPMNTGFSNTAIVALAVDPIAVAVLYAATPVGVFQSRNAGQSWDKANDGLGSVNVLALAVANNGNVYAGTNGSGVFLGQ